MIQILFHVMFPHKNGPHIYSSTFMYYNYVLIGNTENIYRFQCSIFPYPKIIDMGDYVYSCKPK